MKKNILIVVFTIIFWGFLNFGCSKNTENQKDIAKVEADSLAKVKEIKDTLVQDKTDENKDTVQIASPVYKDKDFTARYICPNHCEGSGSDEPGYCPVCGMELIENPNYKAKN